MKYCNPEQIIEKIPEAQMVYLPDDWFANLNPDTSVYESLYRWMLDSRRIPADVTSDLHNRTYVGQALAKRLRLEEKRRSAAKSGLRGEELECAVRWADANSGPHTEFGGRPLTGDLILVVPSKTDGRVSSLEAQMLKKDISNLNNKIRRLASGANFSRWLFSNERRSDPVGDLAGDAIIDKDFPITDNYDEIMEYLESKSACFGALEALDAAWKEYSERYPERTSTLASR